MLLNQVIIKSSKGTIIKWGKSIEYVSPTFLSYLESLTDKELLHHLDVLYKF
jgi:hypothetical protein